MKSQYKWKQIQHSLYNHEISTQHAQTNDTFQELQSKNLTINQKHAHIALFVLQHGMPDLKFEQILALADLLGVELGNKNHSRKNMLQWRNLFFLAALEDIGLQLLSNAHFNHKFFCIGIDGYSRRRLSVEIITLRAISNQSMKNFAISFTSTYIFYFFFIFFSFFFSFFCAVVFSNIQNVQFLECIQLDGSCCFCMCMYFCRKAI